MITLYLGLVFLCANAVEVEVEGDITIDVKIKNTESKGGILKKTEARGKSKDEEDGKEMKANSERDASSDYSEESDKKTRLMMSTKAAALECVYQYPESSQIEAMLSNMMNQLAKVYVRVQDYVSGGGGRRGSVRFSVVNTKNHTYFDEIYKNMTLEYRQVYNTTAWHVPRTNDPCNEQPKLKKVWSHLLDSSVHYLRQAVTSSVDNFLKNKLVSLRKRSAVDDLVENELARVRAAQLNTLCDNFQLCFDELMTQNELVGDRRTLMPNGGFEQQPGL